MVCISVCSNKFRDNCFTKIKALKYNTFTIVSVDMLVCLQLPCCHCMRTY